MEERGLKVRRDPFTGRGSKESEGSTLDGRWRRMENWMRKSHP